MAEQTEAKQTEAITNVDVIVVGAGMSGIASASGLKQFGVKNFILLEKGDTINNFWMNLTYDRVSLHSAYHDIPYDGGLVLEYPAFKNKHELTDYLRRYAKRYDIMDNIQFNKQVININVNNNNDNYNPQWIIKCGDGTTYICNYLLMATSGLSTSNIPKQLKPTINNFKNGDNRYILHSGQYKNGKPFANKNVLVIGNGNSAFEICTDLVQHNANKVTMLSRSPRHVISITDFKNRVIKYFKWFKWLGLIDMMLPSQFMITPRHEKWDTEKQKNMYFSRVMDEISLDLTKYGFPKPEKGVFEDVFLNLNIQVFDWEYENSCAEYIRTGRVEYIQDEVTGFDKENVIKLKKNEKLTDYDAVILATGFYHGLDKIFNDKLYDKLFYETGMKRYPIKPITNGYCCSAIYGSIYFVSYSDISVIGGLANGYWGWECARNVAKKMKIYKKRNEPSTWNKYTIVAMSTFIISLSATFGGIGYLSFKAYQKYYK